MRIPLVASRRNVVIAAALAGLVALLATLLATQLGGPAPASAADHRDAPGLTPPGGDNRADITDIYAFQEPGHPGKSILVLNVNGLTPAGTPAYFGERVPTVAADQRIDYYLYVDKNGDAVQDTTYKLDFGKPGPKGIQKFRLWRNGHLLIKLKNGRTTAFGAAPKINSGGGVRVFAGMRDDPFFFDLPGFLNITAPLDADPTNDSSSFIGCSPQQGRPDFFKGTNVSSIVLEVPNSQLGRSVGVWAATAIGGAQNDRMGRPAIATVFIPNNPIPPDNTGPSQKSTFNHAVPKNDVATFKGEVVNTLQTLFSLNDQGGPVGGTDDPSDDASKIDGLASFLLPDILTYDSSKADGFPNGRRLADDVIDTELGLVTEGLVTTDCVSGNDSQFGTKFPFLAAPHA